MRISMKLTIFILAILLGVLPLLAACDDDDETEAPTPIETPTASPTVIPTETPTVIPTETPIATPTETETPVEDVKITIGNMSDLTGQASQAMIIVDMALADLVRYFNEENLIPGAELEIETYDTQWNPANDIPGYQWLMERGADLFVAGLSSPPVTLKDRLAEDQTVFLSLTHNEAMVEPPGWVFCLSSPVATMTLLKWIAENDWDYETLGPAKVGAVGWVGPYDEPLHGGLETYANAHPEQFEWVGSYVNNFSFTWGPEVEAVKDADYVFLPSTGGGIPTFIREYRAAGGTAKFMATDAQPAFLGLILDAVEWEGIDDTLFIFPNRWQTEDYEIPNLCNELLNKYHDPSDVESIQYGGISYIGSFGMWYGALSVLAESINTVGPQNWTSADLYDTASGFSMTFGGCEEWNWTDTKRTSFNYLGIYEASAEAQDLVRKDPAWHPVLNEP